MDELLNTIKQTPIFEPESSIKGIKPELMTGLSGGSLYFGTGLTTSTAPSVGVPFDLVGMFCAAKMLCNTLKLDHVIQLIADTHALSNSFNTPESVKTIAQRMVDVSGRVAKLLNVKYTPLLASEIDRSVDYRKIMDSIKTEDHEYVRREWADIEFLRQKYGLRLKMSWTIGQNVAKIGFDERLYDLRYTEVLGQPMSFVYLLPGRTLDLSRPKVSPYISIEGERRILLDPAENVKAKIEEAQESQNNQLKSSLKHLENIVHVFEKLHGEIVGSSTTEKVQKIIGMIFE
jgi:hypothetical protein